MASADRDFLKRLHYLSLLASRTGGGPLLAAPRRKLPAGGTEVTATRDYAPGDDYRQIDWVWAARRDELLTKVFEGQTDLHSYLLVDCSASMGAGRPAKFDLARRIAAALGYLSLGRLDRLGVAGFADGLVAESPRLRHQTRWPRLLRFLESLSLQPGPTDLARAARSFADRDQRRGPVVILSDFYDRGGFRPALEIFRYHGYEPRLVQICDPQEAAARRAGEVELIDVETGAACEMVITERMAARYRLLVARFQDSLRDYCGQRGIPCVRIASTMPEEEILRRVIVGR
jgi:uncharacterized protein (DUF58 family)